MEQQHQIGGGIGHASHGERLFEFVAPHFDKCRPMIFSKRKRSVTGGKVTNDIVMELTWMLKVNADEHGQNLCVGGSFFLFL